MPVQYMHPLPIQEIKAAGDGTWEVAGLISTFGGVDLGGDTILRGAFDDTLASGRKIKFLFAHDQSQVLGTALSVKATDDGLFGRFKISRTRLGEDVHTLLKDGALDSFSIGYFPTEFEFDPDTGTRILKKIDLLEASVVAIPMNPDALVTSVKDLLAQAFLPDGQRKDHQPLQFGEHCELVLSMFQGLMARSKSYAAQRESQGRPLSDAFIERLHSVRTAADELLSKQVTSAAHERIAVQVSEQAAQVVKDLIDPGPQIKQDEAPLPAPTASSGLATSIALKRAKLRRAGILEHAS